MKLFATLALLVAMATVASATVVTPPALVDGNGNVVPQYYNGTAWVLDTGTITAVGSITATVTTDTRNSIYNGSAWVNDQGARTITGSVLTADTPFTVYGADTSAGGTTTDTITLSGGPYSLIMVTCEDSCVVMFTGALTGNAARASGIFVDRVAYIPYSSSTLYVVSETAYVYPRAIRVVGLR